MDKSLIEKFCYEEVERQRDLGDPQAVSGLVEAWVYAIHAYNWAVPHDESNIVPLTPDFIKSIGFLAKPAINVNGWRTYPIRIGYDVRSNHNIIDQQITSLVDAYNDGRVDPQTLYLEYEFIHPFGDGNGRTGKILFNWANGTLENPVMPINTYGWVIP